MYPRLNQLINRLLDTRSRSAEEEELLKELMHINELLKRQAYSLAPPAESLSCPQCGYKIYG